MGRFITEEYAKANDQKITQIVSTLYPVLLFVGSLILLVGIVASYMIEGFINIDPDRSLDGKIMLVLLTFQFSINLIATPFTLGFIVRQKYVLMSMIGIVTSLLRIAILFFLLFNISTRVLWVVVAAVGSDCIGIIALVIISKKLVPALIFNIKEIKWPLLKRITIFGGWNLLFQLSARIRMGADVLILNNFGSSLDVANFHLGSMPFRQIESFSATAKRPLMPQLTAMYSTKKYETLGSVYLRGGRYALWVSLALAIPIIIFSRELVILWVGERFMSAHIVMVLLLSNFPLIYGNEMFPPIAFASENLRPLAIRAFLVQLVNLALTIYLVGYKGMGAVGAALSTFLVMTLIYPYVTTSIGLKMVNVSFNEWVKKTLLPGWVPGISGLIVWLSMKIWLQPNTWIDLFKCWSVGTLVYSMILFKFCLQPQDIHDFNNLIKNIKRRFKPYSN